MASSGPVPLTSAPEPKPVDQCRRDPFAAKEGQTRRDAGLPFEEKVEIVLELQEASPLMRDARDGSR